MSEVCKEHGCSAELTRQVLRGVQREINLIGIIIRVRIVVFIAVSVAVHNPFVARGAAVTVRRGADSEMVLLLLGDSLLRGSD